MGHKPAAFQVHLAQEEETERRAHGIPLHKEVIQWFDSICAEMSVPALRTARR